MPYDPENDLVKFLRARLDEDEAIADSTHDARCDALTCPCYPGPSPCDCGIPKRLTADVDAKRALVDWCESDPVMLDGGYAYTDATLKHLALPYSDHEDYREEWRP